MRLRSLLVPAVVVGAVFAVVPSSAAAAPQCSVVAPTKVVLAAEEVRTTYRVAANCAASGMEFAHWELRHAGGEQTPLDFADVAPSKTVIWYDDDPKGTWTTAPVEASRADGSTLTQNTVTTRVKYGSRLRATPKRSGSTLSWTVAATQWSAARHAWVPRPRVAISVWHKPSGATTWRYVRSVTASSTGRAAVSVSRPKSGSYRLVTGETPTVWAGYSTPVRGRG